ncbi:MAG: MoxR family ATPase, partial [Lactobacillus iners]|nr:MoxR family ATPase [Lactobacillus iners]
MLNKKFYPYIAQGANAKQMFNIMQACIRAGVPFGLVGNPGVGKTATIEAMAKTLGRDLINLSLSTMLPEDIAGLPFPAKINIGSDKNEQMVDAACYAMPVWQQRLLHNSNAILFLDEFSTAIPTTQHAFLQLVQNRRLPGSDLPFSKNVAIIIAMNPADQAGGSSL